VNLLKELDETSPSDFKNFLRMNRVTFMDFLEKVIPAIEKQNTTLRNIVSVY
jgi:hypothetical protein